VLVSASLSLLLAAGSAFAAVRWVDVRDVGVDEDLPTEVVRPSAAPGETPASELETTRCSEEPCNYLILGSDSRAGLTPEELERFGTDDDIGGENRADTIMLVHLNPALEKAIILSFPRDLWVEIPDQGWGKINGAFVGGLEGGGPRLMAQTVANLTDLPVHHTLYMDFAGFQGVVDTLGGVDLCIPDYLADPSTGRIQDELTGLDIAPGCQRMDGYQSLAFVRTRHLRCDTIPDFSRIGRQQQFLRAVINQMLRPEKLLQAPTLVEPILENMHRDNRFAVGDLVYLVGQLRGLTTGAAEFRAVPGYGDYESGLSVVKMDPSAQQIFAAIRKGEPISGVGERLINTPPSEANVGAAVVDAGAGPDAEEVLQLLSQAGFAVQGTLTDPAGLGLRERAKSVIAYAPGREAEALVTQAYLPHLPLLEVRELEGVDVAVILTGSYEPPADEAPPVAVECPDATP
jgi:LCP family protein required for cell wall assembly